MMALPLQKSFPEGMFNCIAWLSYDPILGQNFATGLDWILEMATAMGLAGSVIGCLVLVKKQKFPFFAVLVVHFLITVLYGSRMF